MESRMKDIILTSNCQSTERHNKQSRQCFVCLNFKDIWDFRQTNLSCIICLKFRGHNIQLLSSSNNTYKINCPSQLQDRAKAQRGNVLLEWIIYLGRNLHDCFVFCIRNRGTADLPITSLIWFHCTNGYLRDLLGQQEPQGTL